MNDDLVQSAMILSIKSDLEELGTLRGFCKAAAASCWSGETLEDILSRLQLAVTEATTNVIRHAYALNPTHDITLQAEQSDNEFNFDIVHNGKPFDPPSEIPDILEPQEGGMGLFLIQQCVDRIEYINTPDGRQCIRLTIFLS